MPACAAESQTPDTLRLRRLRKSFGPKDQARAAVDGLDLTIRPGEFYALLGANGAGKTTTLRMVAGLLQPDSGEISICGVDARKNPIEAKSRVAWLPDEPLLYDKLAPVEYLEFVAGLWGMDPTAAWSRAENLLRRLDLWDKRNLRCEGFSRGMRQKVALAGALIHEPRLLMLDEPLTGLDAGAARQVKDMLGEQARQGVAIVLTTHILEVAEKYGEQKLHALIDELLDYSERLVRAELRTMPAGEFSAEDWLDDDGVSETPLRIAVQLHLDPEAARIHVDFAGSSPQVVGSVNAVLAITLSACFYVLRCLLREDAPATEGILRPLTLNAPSGSIVDALPPAAVAGGNVETSQRIVDVLLRALAKAIPARIPAASAGTMSNLTIGGVDPLGGTSIPAGSPGT